MSSFGYTQIFIKEINKRILALKLVWCASSFYSYFFVITEKKYIYAHFIEILLPQKIHIYTHPSLVLFHMCLKPTSALQPSTIGTLAKSNAKNTTLRFPHEIHKF